MPNPKAPRRSIRPERAEVESEVDMFARRLRALGADEDEVLAVVQHWDDFDAEWTPERRAQMVRMGDRELRLHIAGARDEFEYATTTEAEEAEKVAAARHEATLDEAREVIDRARNVAEVLGWVDGVRGKAKRVERARAVAEVEASGAKRVTLLREVDAIVDDAS